MAQTATNPKTGEKVEWNGSAWVPLAAANANAAPAVGRTATNPQTGERITWDGKAWVPYQPQGHGVIEAGIREGAADLYSLPNMLGQMTAQPAPAGYPEQIYGTPEQRASVGGAIQSATPSREELMARAERNVGPMTEPQTQGERILKAGARGGTGGLIAGPAGVAAGAIGGMAGQQAAEMNQPQWVQILASVGVPVAAIGSWNAFQALIKSTPRRILERAAANLTPLQAQKAHELMDTAERMGKKITLAEAAAAVTGEANTRLLNLQRILESSPGGQPILTEFMKNRIESSRQAFQNVAGQVAPDVVGEARTMVPAKMQQAAEGAISHVQGVRTAASSPIYKSVTGIGDNLSTQNFLPLKNDPAIAAAIKAVRNDPAYERILQGLPDENMLVLDAAYKHLGDSINSAKIAGETSRASFLQGAKKMLSGAMESEYPDYAIARARHESMSRVIEPTERGPVGKIAENKNGDMGTQVDILTPMNPDTLDARMVAQVARQLKAQDPTALKNWLRINLEYQFNKAMRRRSDPTGQQYGGAQFAANMTGNSKQAENIRVLLEETAGPDAVDGWDNLMKVLDAEGRRMKPGSLTAMNQLDMEDLKSGRMPIGLIQPKAELDRRLTRWQYTNNSEVLARWITGEEAKSILKSMATVQRGTAAERFLFGAFAASFMRTADSMEAENTPKNSNTKTGNDLTNKGLQ